MMIHWWLLAACDHCQISHQCSDRQIGQWSSQDRKLVAISCTLMSRWQTTMQPMPVCQSARMQPVPECQNANWLWQVVGFTSMLCRYTPVHNCYIYKCMQKCTVFTILHCAVIQNSMFNIVAKFAKQVGVSGVTLLVELVYHPNCGGGACEIQTQ